MKNKIIIISFIFLILLASYSAFNFNKNYQNNIKLYEKVSNECKSDITTYETCKEILEGEAPIFDTFTVFFKIVNEETLSILVYIGPLIIATSSVWSVFKMIHSSYIKNYLTRSNYKKFLLLIIKNAYKSIWVIPAVMAFVLILSHMISSNYDYSFAINNSYSTFDEVYLSNFGTFFVTYIINLILFSIFYANLGLCFIKANKNVIVTIIEAFVTFIGIEIINEVLITDLLFYKILNINIQGIINILDVYTYKGVFGYWQYLIVGLIFAVGSFIVVLLVYKDKEKVISSCEELS